MLPFGVHNVTLFHRVRKTVDGRTVEKWQRYPLTRCSWREKDYRVTYEGNAFRKTEVVCRIPDGQQCPSEGDILVKGHVFAIVGGAADAARLLDLFPRSFRVQSVGVNTDAPMPHYAARGDA